MKNILMGIKVITAIRKTILPKNISLYVTLEYYRLDCLWIQFYLNKVYHGTEDIKSTFSEIGKFNTSWASLVF